MTEPINWPSREEWAVHVRTLYADSLPDTSTELADYASPQEIEALRRAILERRKDTRGRLLGARRMQCRPALHQARRVAAVP